MGGGGVNDDGGVVVSIPNVASSQLPAVQRENQRQMSGELRGR